MYISSIVSDKIIYIDQYEIIQISILDSTTISFEFKSHTVKWEYPNNEDTVIDFENIKKILSSKICSCPV